MAHSWPAQSPEANHTVLVSGSGSASTLAHAQELTAQAQVLQALVSASQANAAGIYGAAWSGAGATSSQAAHTGVNAQLVALAAWLQERAPIVTTAAQAYQTAVAAMVPTHEAHANRAQEAADVEANPRVLGALTPQITELNLDYFGHMWPTNASAGTSYAATLHAATAALATPPPPATPGASPQEPAKAAQAMGDAEGRTVAGAAMRQAHGSVQAVSAVTQHGSTMSQAMVPPPTPSAAVTAPSAKFAELRPPPVASAPSAPPPVGMYQQPPSNAAVYGPPALATAPGAAAGIRPGMAGVPAAGPPPAGVTRFVRPAEPFAMPSLPSTPPGILNAATVYAAAAVSPTGAVPVQPFQPLEPLEPPTPPPTPPTQIHSLNPPPAAPAPAPPASPPTTPDPVGSPSPSAQYEISAPPAGPPPPPPPDQGGAQMYGFGPGFTPTPLAPRLPPPTEPPPPPPPPPINEMTPEQLRAAWAALQDDIVSYNGRCAANIVGPLPRGPYERCLAELTGLNEREATLRQHYRDLGIPEPPPPGTPGSHGEPNPGSNPEQPVVPSDEPPTGQPGGRVPGEPETPPPDPSTPTGQRGGPMHVPRGTNAPETIDGTRFSGHALDEMQSDGIPVSVVNNALRTGLSAPS